MGIMESDPSDALYVVIRADQDVVLARKRGRDLAARLGFSSVEQTLIATAISEVARNIVSYAGEGEVTIAPVVDAHRQGIRVIARDSGPGIADTDAAMRDGFSTGKSLGVGLPGARRLMDDFELASKINAGTAVTMTKWLQRR